MMKCPVCNHDMSYQVDTHDWRCSACGLIIDDLVYRVKNKESAAPASSGPMGWVCPKCGRGVSPWQSYCDCDNTYCYKIGFTTCDDQQKDPKDCLKGLTTQRAQF